MSNTSQPQRPTIGSIVVRNIGRAGEGKKVTLSSVLQGGKIEATPTQDKQVPLAEVPAKKIKLLTQVAKSESVQFQTISSIVRPSLSGSAVAHSGVNVKQETLDFNTNDVKHPTFPCHGMNADGEFSAKKEERGFICPSCPFRNEFPNDDVLHRHIELAHVSNRPACSSYQVPNSDHHFRMKQRQECSIRDCGEILHDGKEVIHHIMTKHPHTAYFCGTCFLMCNIRSSMLNHLRIRNHDPLPNRVAPLVPLEFRFFRCELCSFVSTMDEFQPHMESHRNDGKYSCLGCSKMLPDVQAWRGHLICHESQPDDSCKLCDVSFKSPVQYRTHMWAVHPDIWSVMFKTVGIKFAGESSNFQRRKCTCHVCGKSFNDVSIFRYHLYTHDKIMRFNCRFCHEKFSNDIALNYHVIQHTEYVEEKYLQTARSSGHALPCPEVPGETGSVPNRYKCWLCPKVFMTLTSLRLHKYKFHRWWKVLLRYPCKFCSKSFPTREGKTKHLKNCHSYDNLTFPFPNLDVGTMSDEIGSFGCLECTALFDNEQNLRQHVERTHSGHSNFHPKKRPSCFKCRICRLGLPSCRALFLHKLNKHPDDYKQLSTRRFYCRLCPESFLFLKPKVEHEKLHVNGKCHECDCCNRTFTTRLAACRHRVVHKRFKGDDVEFGCSYCPAIFKTPAELKEHGKAQHQRFTCKLCQKSFSQSGVLKTHINRFCEVVRGSLFSSSKIVVGEDLSGGY